jgi:hypothetical protein
VTRRARGAAAALLAGGLLVAGCGEVPSPATAPLAELPELEIERELAIGREDDPDYALVPVTQLALHRTGEVLVAQRQLNEIRVFDREGHFLRRLGGTGQGPGEFRLLDGIGVLGDTVWVRDPTSRNLVQFLDTEGRWLGGTPHPEFPSGYPPTTRVYPLAEGGAVVPTTPGGDRRWIDYEAPWLWFGAEGELVATLPGDRRAASFPVEYTGTMSDGTVLRGVAAISPVLRETTWTALAPDHASFVRAEYLPEEGSPTAELRLVRYTPAGDTLAAGEIVLPRPPVPPELADSLFEAAVSRLARPLGSETEARAEVSAVLRVPSYQPPVHDVMVGLDGGVWLALSGRPEGRWIMFDAEMEAVGVVAFPPDFSLEAADGDEVWGVERDALDVPRVLRYRVVDRVRTPG